MRLPDGYGSKLTVCRKGCAVSLACFDGVIAVDLNLFGVTDAVLIVYAGLRIAIDGHLTVGGRVRAKAVLGAAAEKRTKRSTAGIHAALRLIAADAYFRATAKTVFIAGTMRNVAF